MYTQENSEEVSDTSGQQPQQGEEVRHKIMRGLPATILLVLSIISWIIYFQLKFEWKSGAPIHWLPVSILITITTITIIWLQNKWFIPKNTSSFNLWIFGVTIIGGSISFLFPLAITDNFSKDGEGTALRQMLIYATGGLLGVITLSETRRKNDQEKRKNEQEKEKNENDHIRQVHTERRNRYAQAIEQLTNENAAVRLGGAYTLIGLVDEWLDDNKSIADNDESSDKPKKEGQIIVNNLCAYIKSPLESETKTTTSHVTSQEERRIRQAILHEIHVRLSSKNSSSEPEEYKPGPWSKFSFDFSNSDFFYPVDFSNGFFEENINFTESTFTESVNFKNARFKKSAIFNFAKFISTHANNDVSFEKAEVSEIADFSSSLFTIALNCENAVFNDEIRINKSHFIQITLYSENIHYCSEPVVEDEVTGTGYMELSVERRLIPQDRNYNVASFAGATFNNGFTIQGTYSEGFINFTGTPEKITKFSYETDPSKINFTLHKASMPINTKEITAPNGRKFDVPKGCAIFNPDNPSESVIFVPE